MTREKLLAKLQLCVDDPMWADHVEMPKQLLRVVIEHLGAHAQCAPTLTDEIIDLSLSEFWDVSPRGWNGTQRVAMRKAIETALSSTPSQAIEKTEGGAS